MNSPGWQSRLEKAAWPDSELLLLSSVTPAEEAALLAAAARSGVPLVLVGSEAEFSAELRVHALAVLPEGHLHPSVLQLLWQNWQQRQELMCLVPKAQELDDLKQAMRDRHLPPDPLHHLDFVASGAPGGLYQSRIEADGRYWFNYLSPAVRQFFSLGSEQETFSAEVLLTELVAPEALQRVMEAKHAAAQNLSLFRELIPMVGRQGQSYWIETIAKPVLQADGAVQFFGVVIDRTEEIRARQQRERIGRELQVRQQLQEQLLELIPSNYWIFNLATGEVEEILGSRLSSWACLMEMDTSDRH